MSLAYLAAYLKKYGYEVNILDAVAGGITRKGKMWHYGLLDSDLVKRIKQFRPDLVGITSPFSLRNEASLKTARLVKGIDKKIITVVGGIHPSIFPLETVSCQEIDYVIVGEGEESFLSLVRHIESGSKISKLSVDGCAYKEKGKPKLRGKRSFIKNLDSLPFPARELLPMEFYFQRNVALFGLGKARAASIITSRGCPYRCSFCSMHLSHGLKWRSRSAENVFEEIEELVKKYGVEEIFFMDDNLTFDKERIMKLCELILAKGLRFRWNTPNGIRADRIDSDLAAIMKKSGCANVCIGIESGSERIRNGVIKKALPEEKIHQALSACKKVGLPVIGFFILGIPGESEETFRETIDMVKSLPLEMIATSFYTPFPGTKLYEESVRDGHIKKDYWRSIEQFSAPIVETRDFDKNILKKWEKRIYYEFLKSHFWRLAYSVVTLKNSLFEWGLIRRFIKEKFNV